MKNLNIHGTFPFHKLLYSGKSFCFDFLNIGGSCKNCLLGGSLWNQKWFFCGISVKRGYVWLATYIESLPAELSIPGPQPLLPGYEQPCSACLYKAFYEVLWVLLRYSETWSPSSNRTGSGPHILGLEPVWTSPAQRISTEESPSLISAALG